MADTPQFVHRGIPQVLSRRAFLSLASLATGALMVGRVGPAAAQTPAQLRGTRLSILQWVNFVPAHDAALKKQIAEFEKLTGAKVTFETINMNDIQARTTVAIESKAGPDIIQLAHNWPHLYEAGLEPVDDLAEELGQKGEGYYDLPKSHSFVNGRWRAVPHSMVSGASTYRTDWFKEVGYDKFPDTWEEYREVGKKLKANGHPIGQALGHSLGDPPFFCYAVLWAFGGKEVEADGKTVALDSKETLEAVEFAWASGRTPATRVAWPGTMPITTAPIWRSRSRPPSTAPASGSRPSATSRTW